jgi:lipoate-protein ligase A
MDRLNLYYFERSSVSLGMALDEILFQETEQTGTGFLRVSVFDPPGTTLGYFQTFGTRDLQDASWTRRPSGGGIVEHKQDLILSLSHSLPKAKNPTSLLYHEIHETVKHALSETIANLDLNLIEEYKPCCDGKQARETYCFTSPVQYDIYSPQGKIVGGALSRKRKSFLYQGSLQMSRLVSSAETRNNFQAHLEKCFENLWGVSFQKINFSPEQRIQAETLAKTKYLTPAWKGKY